MLSAGPDPRPLAIALIALLTVSAVAQDSRRITGAVTDTEGTPLSGVAITIAGRPEPTPVLTGDDGSFAVADLAPGSYSIQAALAGFRTDSKTIQIKEGRRAAPLKFVLKVGVLSEALFVMETPRDAVRKAKAIALVRLESISPPVECEVVVSNVHNATVLDVWKGRLPSKVQIDEPNKGSCVDGDRVVGGIGGDQSSYAAGSELVVLLSGSGKGNRYGGLGAGSYVFPVRDGVVSTGGFAELPDSMRLAEFRESVRRLAR